MKKIRYFSTFSGIGGFELGIGKSGKCIGYSEIDKYAIQVYEKHFKHKNYGDITKIIASELPDFDLLVGGFPCQSFSIAGKRGGFQDTRGTLFFDIARIIKEKKPAYLLLENVKGLLNHDKGNTFATIVTTLDELGYDCEWQVLNSKDFGVPQNRERVFIVGYFRGKSRGKIFPIEENGEIFDEKKRQIRGGISVEQSKRIEPDNKGKLLQDGKNRHLHTRPQSSRVREIDGIASTLNSGGGGMGAKTGLYFIAPNGKQIDISNAPNKPFQLSESRTEKGKQTRREIKKSEKRDSTLRGPEDKKYVPKKDDIANCITTGKENIEKWIFENTRIRRLTPKECERLMGFPDDWTKYGAGGGYKRYTKI